MRIYYPRSFAGLLILGFTLVALPLMIGLIHNAVSIDRIVNRSQAALYQAVAATQGSRRLAELLNALERSARQMLILGDRSMYEAYASNRKQLQEVSDAFAELPFDQEQRRALDQIMAGEAAIYAAMTSVTTNPERLRQAVHVFDTLGERSRELTMHGNKLIDREIQTLRASAARAQHIALWQVLALIPIVVFLATGFAILITRPIRELDAAIRDLGRGELDRAISITGPVDLRDLGERLEWTRQKLLQLDEQKKRFLQQVSHELKTPLTALREGAELLADEVVGKLSPAQREVTEIFRVQSRKLQKLIESLLAHTAGHSQTGKLAYTRVDMRHLIHSVADDQKLALQARGLALNVHADEAIITGDAEKLRIMFDNLLSNAIKFAPAHSAIDVRLRHGRDYVELLVSDDGPGIAPAERERVFEPLYQGRSRAHGLVKGTGIGLSLVKDCVQSHGGTVDIVDDARRRGASLRVRLPSRRQEART